MLTEELKEKIDLYEKIYFATDEPVPFRKDIKIYPVMVKDYYSFYSLLPCFTMDKNIKKVTVMEVDPMDKNGGEKPVVKEVSNPLGMQMSYMAYLCEMMMDETMGKTLTQQVMGLMEMVLHIKNGFFCPHCHSEKAKKDFDEIIKGLAECKDDEEKNQYWMNIMKCPDCGEPVREIYTIKDNGKRKKFCIGDYECTAKDFDELIAIVCHMNILGYDDDEYIDPDLKKDLDLKKKLQNQDFQSPTLEKQIGAVSISTGFLPKVIMEEFTIRRLSFYLRLIDSKMNYQICKTASLSGFVSFKGGVIEHWIYSKDEFGRDATKELKSVEQLQKDFSNIT